MLRVNTKSGDWIYQMGRGEWCIRGNIKIGNPSKTKFANVENQFYKMDGVGLNRTNIEKYPQFIAATLVALRYYSETESLKAVGNALAFAYGDVVLIRKIDENLYKHFVDRKIDDHMWLFQKDRFEDGVEYECEGYSKFAQRQAVLKIRNAFGELVLVPMECCRIMSTTSA